MPTALNRIPKDGQLGRLPIQFGMSIYNILVSVRRVLAVNEYSLSRNWGTFVQQNGKVEAQKYECRLRRNKKAGKARNDCMGHRPILRTDQHQKHLESPLNVCM
jgi:hypothetical protein